MTNHLVNFINNNADLINCGRYEDIFQNAFDEALLTSEVRELAKIFEDVLGYNSNSLRSDLLYDTIKYNLDFLRKKYKGKDPGDMLVKDSYAAQFLRTYLNNTYGYLESEAIDFMWQNQTILGIKMTPVDSAGIYNYTFVFI